MNIISDPDLGIVGTVTRDAEDGIINVRLCNVDEGDPEEIRIYIDDCQIFGRVRPPKDLPPLLDEDDMEINFDE